MDNREKVIDHLEDCVDYLENNSMRHWVSVKGNVVRVALELLKAQEPVHVKYIKAAYGNWLLSVCGNCGEQIREDWKCCPVCGKAVKWE